MAVAEDVRSKQNQRVLDVGPFPLDLDKSWMKTLTSVSSGENASMENSEWVGSRFISSKATGLGSATEKDENTWVSLQCSGWLSWAGGRFWVRFHGKDRLGLGQEAGDGYRETSWQWLSVLVAGTQQWCGRTVHTMWPFSNFAKSSAKRQASSPNLCSIRTLWPVVTQLSNFVQATHR